MKDRREKLRELTGAERQIVNGGNIPAILTGISFAWNVGYSTGLAINRFNASRGTSLGSAIYQFAK